MPHATSPAEAKPEGKARRRIHELEDLLALVKIADDLRFALNLMEALLPMG